MKPTDKNRWKETEWWTDGDIYIFYQDPEVGSQMVADHYYVEEQVLSDVILDLQAALEDMRSGKGDPLALIGSCVKKLQGSPILMGRGVGAGLSPREIMQYVCDLHNNHLKNERSDQ